MQKYRYISYSAKKSRMLRSTRKVVEEKQCFLFVCLFFFFSKVDTVLTFLHGKYFALYNHYFSKQIKVVKSSEISFISRRKFLG